MEIQFRKPEVIPVNDHIWLLNDHNEATCYVVAGTEKAAVIDTSVGLCNVREAAEALTDRPLLLINTHGHGDHCGGNWPFDKAYMNPADLPIAEDFMSNPQLKEAMEQYGVSYPPFAPLEDGQIIDLGGVELEVIFTPGHTPGEIVLLDRKDRILFAGDGVIDHLWLQLDHSLPVAVQLRSMEKVAALRGSFDRILHGHCQEPRDAELFDTLLAALRDLVAGNTAEDIDYVWYNNVSRAHPYQPGDRRIVYKKSE